MKQFLTIVISSIYLAFTIGITLHVHQCSDGFIDSELVIATPTDHCDEAASHACCSEPIEKSCCEQNSSEDDCCYDGQVFIQLEQPQVVSKSMLIFSLPDVSIDNTKELVNLYTTDSIQKEVMDHPPPTSEVKRILYCSFTFYG